ncbi:MAG: aldehyde ferredoxin oxidoreductase family protein [Thermoplasmata archaeon]
MNGWTKYVLYVDLSRQKILKEDLPKHISQYIGGRGMNVRFLFDLAPPNVDPFSESNPLIFGVGPLVGTLAPAACRFNVTTKSPFGYLGDSNCGGDWGAALKFAGYNHIIVSGRSERPVYLLIDDERVELREAKNLWGSDTWKTQKILNEIHGEDFRSVCIGPAGENLVRFACIKTGLKHAAARTGTGAVMGSKRLKAITVRGTGSVSVADPENFMESVERAYEMIKDLIEVRGFKSPVVGTYGYLWWLHDNNCKLGVMHHRYGSWEKAAELDPIYFHKNYRIKILGDFSCPVQCMPRFKVDESLFGEGPEYEMINSFGSMVGNSDLKSVLEACIFAEKMGIDGDSAGRVVAFAIELYEKGILSKNEVPFPLRWGDGDCVLKLLKMIVLREGIGDTLAEGEAIASKTIGKGAEKYALTMKGLELHEPLKSGYGHALSHSTSTRGPDHLRSSHHPEHSNMPEQCSRLLGDPTQANRYISEGKERMVVFNEYTSAFIDSLGCCKFLSTWGSILEGMSITPHMWAEIYKYATGMDVDGKSLLEAGERIYNVERAFIVREGVRRKDDIPPEREFNEPYPTGKMKGFRLEREKYEKLLSAYYELHGWDEDGVPTENRLRKLGLGDLIEPLKQAGVKVKKMDPLKERDYITLLR